jgi:putative transposase
MYRSLSRRVPHPRNWLRAKVKSAKAYEHLKNMRKDLYLRIREDLVEKHDIIVVKAAHLKSLVGDSYRELRTRIHDVALGGNKGPAGTRSRITA